MPDEKRFIEFLEENGVKEEFERKVTREIGNYFSNFTLMDYLSGGYPQWYINGAFVMDNKWRKLDKQWQKLNK